MLELKLYNLQNFYTEHSVNLCLRVHLKKILSAQLCLFAYKWI